MDDMQVIASELRRLEKLSRSLGERRLAWLDELAYALCRGRGSDILNDEALRGEYLAALEECMPGEASADMPEDDDFSTRIYLCRAIAERSELTGFSALASALGARIPPRRSRIAYFRNSFADEAYARFAAELPEPTVTYSHDFAGVCEDVYYSRAQYCILPIENSSEGRLDGFRRLIDKYELKLAMTCTVVGESCDTLFGLLSRTLISPERSDGSAPGWLRFSFSARDVNGSFERTLRAAERFGLHTVSLGTNHDLRGEGLRFSLTLDASEGELAPFCTTLALNMPGYEPDGLYIELC